MKNTVPGSALNKAMAALNRVITVGPAAPVPVPAQTATAANTQQYVCVYADICTGGSTHAPGRNVKDPCKHAVPHPMEGVYGCDHMHCEPHLKAHQILNGACCLPIVDEVVCEAASKCNPGGCRHATPHAKYEQCEVPCPDALKLKLPVGCQPTGKKVVRMPQ